MRTLLNMLFCVLFLNSTGQYTYFNITEGIEGDQNAEAVTNIEIINNEIYTWGKMLIDGQYHESLQRYSEEGELIQSVLYTYENSLVFIGTTNSFQRIPGEDAFLMSHAIVDAEGTHGFLMKVDSNLDTLWTRKMDIFPPYTYFFTHAWDEDGFILAGEYGLGPGVRGTFIAKVDLDGNYLWHEILHEPSEGAFRNLAISPHVDGYVLSGASGAGIDTEGYVENVSDAGAIIWSDSSQGDILRGTMHHLITQNDDIIVSQGVGYQDYPGASDPLYTNNVLRYYLVNQGLGEIENAGEFLASPPWILGGAVKIIESNSGYLFTGSFLKETEGFIPARSFILKTDYDFNEEWYTELSYNPCPSCENRLYDVEQATDGGYVMVGKFNDAINDPYDKTWLVKVDACGDLVWQGCEPVGVDDFGASASLSHLRLELYPNPASDVVRVATPIGAGGECWERIELIGITAKVVKKISNGQLRMLNDEVEVDVSELPSGLYSIVLTTDEGNVYSSKLIIE